MSGFGHQKFGNAPFGKSDAGKDLVVDLFPEEYIEDSAPVGTDPFDDTTNPLLQILKTYANSVSKRRDDIDLMPTLIDYERAPENILLLIGDMLSLGIDQNDPEFLKRSFVGNASQWLQIKSTVKGYQVRGLASGFTVEVDTFWRIDESYAPLIPLFNQYRLKPVGADAGIQAKLHTDSPPGSFAGTPITEDPTYAKSAYVRLVFTLPPNSPLNKTYTGFGPPPCFDFNIFLDLIIDKIKDVAGIHHELIAPQFLTKFPVIQNVAVATSTEIDEQIRPLVSEASRFDQIPADVIPLDSRLQASMVINE